MGFLSFLLLPLLFASSACSLCPITTCSNTTTIPVRFPFRVNHQQPENCGYLGFNLYCTDQGLTALDLPQSGQYLVRYISYQTQSIRLYDPGSCLPRRLLDGFDPSGSPFEANSYVNYIFLSCPRNFTSGRFTIIGCLSNSTTSVLALSQSTFAHKMFNKSCKMIKTLRVPNSLPENDLGLSPIDDIWLSWDIPDCKDCEVKGGFCGFQNNGSQQIGCSHTDANSGDNNMQHTGDSKGLKIFRIVAFSIAVPAIICAMAMGLFLCIIDRRDLTSTRASRAQQQVAVMPQPQEAPEGLDQATIDTYTKVVLGESRRVPGLNDGSCPICLSEFNAKDTLRCIPDCQHCFHADCIDEWLRMNGTYPLCRNSPAHHLQVQIS